MSWQDMTQSSLCSGVKDCGTKRAHIFLFFKSSLRNQRTTVLGMFKDFAYPSWCNMMVIFDQISNSSSDYLSLSRFWIATSLIIFYQLPSIVKLRIPPKNIWLVQSHIPISLLFLSQIDWLWNKIFWQLSVHFRHPWRVEKTDFTRQVITRTLSNINKRNSVCERTLVDST